MPLPENAPDLRVSGNETFEFIVVKTFHLVVPVHR